VCILFIVRGIAPEDTIDCWPSFGWIARTGHKNNFSKESGVVQKRSRKPIHGDGGCIGEICLYSAGDAPSGESCAPFQ